MTNLLETIKKRTAELKTTNSTKFNTNDFLLEVLVDKKIDRNDVVDLITARRIEMMNLDQKIDQKEFHAIIDKTYKTSKNGLDTSVSDSNNNSSFSYNAKYDGYKLIKENNTLSIVKIKK